MMRIPTLAVLLGLMLGLTAATAQEAPQPSEAEARLAEVTAQLAALQAQVDELSAEVVRLRAERDRFSRALARLAQWSDALEADRLLLAELRKTLPETRIEAEAYLRRLQRLALQSDPVRLGPIANRLMQAAPIYLDWREQEFASDEEAARAFVQSGARGFNTTFTDFRNAVLLTVSNRLDALLGLFE